MDDTRKAHLVWAAAFPRGKALDDQTAAKLGAALEQAAEWYGIAKSRRPSRENRHFQKITNDTSKLLQSLDTETINRLGNFVSSSVHPSWVAELVAGLNILRDAALEAQSHKGGGEVLSKKFGSPQGIFIELLREIYFEFSRKRPGRSLGTSKRPGGPFPRFVIEAARQFGIPIPSAHTISKRLQKRHRHG
jgi:hypothetical protein